MLATYTWLITGCNRGLGLEMVTQLVRSPANIVVATCRNPDSALALQELRNEFSGRLHVIQLEVTDSESIERCVLETEKALGGRGLDYLLNNAGVSEQRDTAFTFDSKGFMSTFHANVLGPSLVSRAFLPVLEKGNRKVIMNMSSQLGSKAWKFGAPYATYAACKSALNMLTTKQAFERPDLIVFCMCPGWCKTDMGGDDAPLDPKVTMEGLLKFISSATSEHSGRYWRWNGEEIEW